MKDKDLLGLAAKAAEMAVEVHEDRDGGWFANGIHADGSPAINWNPLASDAEAFRLAVKLRMGVEHNHNRRGAKWVMVSAGDLPWSESMGDEYGRLAATRRAIVRAAAEIGRNMP